MVDKVVWCVRINAKKTSSRVHICTSVYVKVTEGNIDMLYSEHMEQQQQQSQGCCISYSAVHCDDLYQHTVTLTPPLSKC